MFFIFREIQVYSMQYLRWITQSMQHECCESVFLKGAFPNPHFESKYRAHENAEYDHRRDPCPWQTESTGEKQLWKQVIITLICKI